MAEIKDKVVTAESLSALHEYNKQTYLPKNNPVVSGTLSLNRKSDTNIGEYSAALGMKNTASGTASYAGGINTTASGTASYAGGSNTIAAGKYQHVLGILNIEDVSDRYAYIVGNGSSNSNRSNAHTVDWNGNAWYSGDVYVSGTSQDDGVMLVKSTNVISIEYGDKLPDAGTVGRVFFKRLAE